MLESIREGIRNQNNFVIQDTESFISAPVVSLVLLISVSVCWDENTWANMDYLLAF